MGTWTNVLMNDAPKKVYLFDPFAFQHMRTCFVAPTSKQRAVLTSQGQCIELGLPVREAVEPGGVLVGERVPPYIV